MAKNNIKTYQVGDLIIEIDRTNCISCGSCTFIAPDTFELDKQMISVVKVDSKDSLQIIKDAASSCPTQAIIVKSLSRGK